MFIKNLSLINYRNYMELDLGFNRGFNILYGKNAQGKTNILESIFLCSSGRSHRTSKDFELINFSKDFFHISIDVEKKYGDNNIEIVFSEKDGKQIHINGDPIRRKGELMGVLNTVLFSPEDLEIIKGGPSVRRRFMDIAISQVKPSYFFNLQQYLKVLKERNHLLKAIKVKRNLINTLDIWNEKLSDEASKIIYERIGFIDSINDIIEVKHRMLSKGEKIKLKYRPSLDFDGDENKEQIKSMFLSKLNLLKDRELAYQSTLIGPQREDFTIEINGKAIKQFGSQGQQRTAVLSMKLSEVSLIFNTTGEQPVLLLDDVFSELDDSRRNHLIENLHDTQVFITTTHRDSFQCPGGLCEMSYFNVDKGKVYNI